eukprot:Phypoly_transcript_20798.p1 GENE.Phypoly_transcript_20798~~Phypoly_transcript_20798.p1  ORF type:complete len:192 (+),score=29.60 Phypoly_transcript_20798:42-578(+)
MSQQYKDSPNCRLEGEYCVNRRVDYIPIMMQAQYHPDGWLGIALGSKLYHDFSSDHDWDVKINTLAKEIGERGKGQSKRREGYAGIGPQNPNVPPPLSSHSTVLVGDWKLEDLLPWMKAERIEKHHAIFLRHKLDGKALLALKPLVAPASPNFFPFFNMMGIQEIGEMLRLSTAIMKL